MQSLDTHREIIEIFFKFGQKNKMDSDALEKAIVGILAIMAGYRTIKGGEAAYLQGLATAAESIVQRAD